MFDRSKFFSPIPTSFRGIDKSSRTKKQIVHISRGSIGRPATGEWALWVIRARTNDLSKESAAGHISYWALSCLIYARKSI